MTVFSECFAACILNLYMVCFLCYEDQHTITCQAQNGFGLGQNTASKPHPLPTQRHIFGRVRVNGKLIRRSLETHVLTVAKLKVSDFLQDHRRLRQPKRAWSCQLCNQPCAASPSRRTGFKSDMTRTNHARKGIIG